MNSWQDSSLPIIDSFSKQVTSKFKLSEKSSFLYNLGIFFSRYWQLESNTCLWLTSSVLFAIAILAASILFKRRKRPQLMPTDALKALLHVTSPTCSLWPIAFRKIAKNVSSCGKRTILLDIDTLLPHVLNGDIELRHGCDSLMILLGSGMVTHGWVVRLTMGVGWKFQVWAQSSLNRILQQPFHCPALPTTPLGLITSTVCLDYVTNHHLEPFLYELRERLIAEPERRVVTLAFSTYGSALQAGTNIQDPKFVLASIPYLPRENVKKSFQNTFGEPFHLGRTSAALHLSLLDILSMLSTSPALTVALVRNVSTDYATRLDEHASGLARTSNERNAFVERWGERGVREERFFTMWEAAMVRMKYLERWEVCVHA